jgi:sugar/nucleoside kinase (ribokinase family)
VTIDSPHDTFLHKHAAVNVVSGECLHNHYNGAPKEEVMPLLQETAEGLVIITSGGGEMIYGRKGEEVKHMKPFPVEVKSTLGAGDTYKAGCVYALLHDMKDDQLVRFASACSGIAISRFPLPLNPPTLKEVNTLIAKGN